MTIYKIQLPNIARDLATHAVVRTRWGSPSLINLTKEVRELMKERTEAYAYAQVREDSNTLEIKSEALGQEW